MTSSGRKTTERSRNPSRLAAGNGKPRSLLRKTPRRRVSAGREVAEREARRRMARETNREPGQRRRRPGREIPREHQKVDPEPRGTSSGEPSPEADLQRAYGTPPRNRQRARAGRPVPLRMRDKLRRENLASAAEGFAAFRKARSGASRRRGDQTPRAELARPVGADARRKAGFGAHGGVAAARSPSRGGDRSRRMCCGDGKPRESRRG